MLFYLIVKYFYKKIVLTLLKQNKIMKANSNKTKNPCIMRLHFIPYTNSQYKNMLHMNSNLNSNLQLLNKQTLYWYKYFNNPMP